MPAGLQIWDDVGNLVLDYSTRVSQTLGTLTLPDDHGPGSMNIPELARGEGYVVVISQQKFKGDGVVRKIPQASISDTTLSWTAGDGCYLSYGIF